MQKSTESIIDNHFYRVLPILPRRFYYGVQMIELNKQIIYIASPLRALMDYEYL